MRDDDSVPPESVPPATDHPESVPPATDHPETERWARLATEQRHPSSLELDLAGTESIVEALVEEDRRGLARVLARRAEIARAADWLAETLARDSVVCFAGAGTSGRLGVIEAAECPPTFGTDPDRILALIAGGPGAVFAAREGAEDRFDDGEESVRFLEDGDLLIAISASSVTPYVRGALSAARQRGARTVLLTCASQADTSRAGTSQAGTSQASASIADLVIALDTGPELLAGSTRLKAGSATKAALNAITTAAMVRGGKVFENLMVDLRTGSAKLRDRAVRIATEAGRVSRATAERLLDEAQGELKTAIVMARCDIGVEAARRRLDRAGGHVRAALASERP